jgi:hypothetical protein
MRPPLSLPLLLTLAACSTPAPETDASTIDAAAPADTAVHGIHWAMGPPLPEPLAYATAQLFPVSTDTYVYVFGGSTASRSSLGTVSSAVYRARLNGDSLDAWERVGDIAPAGSAFPLVGHGLLPINDAMGNPGAAMAGGGNTSSALPIVLAIYCDPTDGHLFDWSRYPQMLHDAQTFGVFAPLDPFDYALVGGLVGGIPSDRVVSASIRNGVTSMTWDAVPSLPAPRSRHAYFVVAQQIYLLGGENSDGVVGDVIRTTRDASDAVSGWEVVGHVDGAPVAHAAFTYRSDAWLVGGIDGTTFDGAVSARVRHAPLGSDGHVGDFVDDAESLPIPLAGSAFATDYDRYYLIGGMTAPDLTATDAVVIGTVY